MDFRSVDAFLFDLDGTLVDTVDDLAASIDRALVTMDKPLVGAVNVRKWIGNGLDRLLKRALTGTADGEPDPGEVAQAHALFDHFYAEHICEASQLYAGAEALLQLLEERRLGTAIVTNKPRVFTDPLIDRIGIRRYINVVVAGGDTEQLKPDPEPIFQALAGLGVEAGSAVMIGDSSNDVDAAHNAGMPCVGVSYGYNHGEDIRDSGAELVVDSLSELFDLIPCHPKG
jgi:phosphoglycolate phosphatase